jgi:cysteine desulfurase family protein (TIGR01976 family)
VTAVAFDVEAVRARFSALEQGLVFFDGPGGTQVPDSVIDAIAGYYRADNANLGGEFETSRRSERVVADARLAAAGFLGCSPDEVAFGQNTTTLNFALTRALGRELQAGDEILCTRLDHDANVAPWLQLARDLGLEVRFAELTDECRIDLADLESKLSDRTRVVAFPWASNAVGTITEVERICGLAHDAGALAWVDAVQYAPHGPIDVSEVGADVVLCSAYKFCGPHLGLAFGRAELLGRLDPYKVRPADDFPVGHRFETGTLAHELLAGFTAAVDYLGSLGWEGPTAHERALGQRFLDGLPESCTLYGPPTMEGRLPTFAFTVAGRTPQEVAVHLGEAGIAVWHGNYYAVEVMGALGLEDGAVRVGIVHYNTAAEVDRLLEQLGSL